METLCDSANALQRATQKGGEVHAQSRLRQARTLEGSIVVARQNPGFVRDARSVGPERNVIAAGFDHARGLTLLLIENVTENTSLFFRKIFASRPQFVE